ncbi:MAG: CoA-binding protein [Pseudomonadales bacterium]|jgi:predicted CoA-binding protein|tara:strand:+ start:387 stop:773 length:387 start_codon:yes stop_codon:yes gene_type:complete
MNIQQILHDTKTIAIVGLSANPSRASFQVAQYLMPHYEIIPINPAYEEVLGLRCYPDLQSVPVKVDMVDVFQRSENVMPFVQPSIDIGAKYFWMQLDIRNDDARQQLEAVGVIVVDDLCTKIEHARYC